jgi:hypothetical protein
VRSWRADLSGRTGFSQRKNDFHKRKKKEQKERNVFGRGKPVETAAVEEIDQRWAFSNNLLMISTAAGKSLRQEHFGFFTVTAGSTTINPGRQKSKHPNSEKRHLHKVQDTPSSIYMYL